MTGNTKDTKYPSVGYIEAYYLKKSAIDDEIPDEPSSSHVPSSDLFCDSITDHETRISDMEIGKMDHLTVLRNTSAEYYKEIKTGQIFIYNDENSHYIKS